MKKIITVLLGLLIFSMVLKYFVSEYTIQYKIDGHNVKEKYEDGYLYFEIDSKYNYVIEGKRRSNKGLVTNITQVGNANELCIYPKMKKIDTYPLCFKDDKNIAYYLIEDKEIKKFIDSLEIQNEVLNSKESFKFFNNLEKEEYMAVYKYDGFYILNGSKIKSVNLFNKDRYDNSLCEQIDHYLVLPVESEFNYNSVIVLDILTGKTFNIESDYEISFDSKILGHLDNSVYILDNKNSIEYEVNIKKKEITIIGNKEDGYKVYKNGRLKTGMLGELKSSSKWSTYDDKSIYTYEVNEDSITSYIEFNDKINNIIYNSNSVILSQYRDNIYILDNHSIYKINPLTGPKKLLIYEELNYNKENTIYIYNNK